MNDKNLYRQKEASRRSDSGKKGSNWHRGGEADAAVRPLSTYYVFSGGVAVSKASATLSQYVMQRDWSVHKGEPFHSAVV